jgi:O-succinylbenzoate synthase
VRGSPINLDEFLETPISFKSFNIYVLELPLKEVFQTGIGFRFFREAIIVEWQNQHGHIGYGEASCRSDCFYSHEYTDAAVMTIQRFIAPLLSNCKTYGNFIQQMKLIRGWNFTKAAVEAALNDLIYRMSGFSILDTFNGPRASYIPVGISIGIIDDEDSFRQHVEIAIVEGYSRIKFKIKPSVNLNNFKWLKSLDLSVPFSFDANGTFTLEDMDTLAFFAEFGVEIEQPFPPGRLDMAIVAKKKIENLLICLDEEIHSKGQLVAAHQLGLIDELNVKPGRLGGLFNTLEILDYCNQTDLKCWIGGMFETGIGRSQNIQIASLLPKAIAHDLSPSQRYFETDILVKQIEMGSDGRTSVQAAKDMELNEAQLHSYLKRQVECD